MFRLLKVITGFFFSLFAVLLVLGGFLLSAFKEPIDQYIINKVSQKVYSATGLEVSVQDLNINIANEISFQELTVMNHEKKVLSADSLTVSYSLNDLVQMFFTSETVTVKVSLEGLNADIRQSETDLIGTFKQNTTPQNGQDNEKVSLWSKLTDNLEVDFVSRDSDVNIEYLQNEVSFQNAIVQFKLSNGFKFNGAKISSQALNAYIKSVDLTLDVETFVAIMEESLKLNTEKTTLSFMDGSIDLDNVNFEIFSSDLLSLIHGKGQAEIDFHIDNILKANASFDFDNTVFDLNLNLDDFDIWDSKGVISHYVPVLEPFLNKDTSVGGALVIEGYMNTGFPVLDADVELNVNNFNFQEKKTSASVFLVSHEEEMIFDVSTLKVDVDDFELNYSGRFDLNKLQPSGSFTVSRISDKKEMVSFSFEKADSSSGYLFETSSPYLDAVKLSGKLKQFKSGRISADVLVDSPYIVLPFNMDLNLNPIELSLSGDNLKVEASLQDSKTVECQVETKEFKLDIKEDLPVFITSNFSVLFDLNTTDFSVDCPEAELKLSETREAGFGFTLDKSLLSVSQINFKADSVSYAFDGKVDISFSSIESLLNGDYSSLNLLCDLKSSEDEDFIQIAYDGVDYYAKLLLKKLGLEVLGEKLTFMAQVELPGLAFTAKSNNGQVVLSEPKGSFGDLKFDDFRFLIDLPTRTFDAGLKITNTIHNTLGDVSQSAVVGLNGCLKTLNINSLSWEGIDFSGVLNLSLKEGYLDKYKIPDLNIDCLFNKSGITWNSDLIKGNFNFANSFLNLEIEEKFIISLKAEGNVGSNLDIHLFDISAPVNLINQFADLPLFNAHSGIVSGDLSITGKFSSPVLYGLLEGHEIEFDLFWLPEQVLNIQRAFFSVSNNYVTLAPCSVYGYSLSDFRNYHVSCEGFFSFENIKSPELSFTFRTMDNPLEFWFPYSSGSLKLNVLGDVTGLLGLQYSNSNFLISADALGENMNISMVIPESAPSWYFSGTATSDIDVKLTVGSNVEFFYPDEENSFLNFTCSEGSKLNLTYDHATDSVGGGGKLYFKTGRIYYFNNEFSITDGNLSISDSKLSKSSDYSISVDLTAKLREYDQDGNLLDIYLILKNSNLSEINPRFESSSNLTENEIIQLLGQGFFERKSDNSVVGSAAYVALMAGDAISRLGILNFGNGFSINKALKKILNFDIISVRSPLIQNIIVQSLFSSETQNLSLPARYLDGTSLFVGKYLSKDIFTQLSLILKANDNQSSNESNVLVDDLNIDIEFSLDWENELGTYTLFVQPKKFSVSSILDTIGFGFSKHILF